MVLTGKDQELIELVASLKFTYPSVAASRNVNTGIMFCETAAIKGDVSWRPARNNC